MITQQKDILVVIAHMSEAAAVKKAIEKSGYECETLVTGVGGMAMSWALQKRFSEGGFPPLVINAGIAGSYLDSIIPGDVVLPVSDCFADMGVDDNGSYVSLFNANLADPDVWPFSKGRILCSNNWVTTLQGFFRPVAAATVNMSSGSADVIKRIRKAWDPEIETMEGAWFSYFCSMHKIDYFSLRAISNIVEPRDKKKWDIPLALQNLEDAMYKTLNLIKGI